MRNIQLYYLIFLISGCSSNSQITKNLPLSYHWDGGLELASTLQLKENNQFSYSWQQGLIFGQTIGTFEIEGDFIMLNSDNQPQDRNFTIEAFQYNSKDDRLLLKIVDENLDPAIGATCELYDHKFLLAGATTQELGFCKLDKEIIDSGNTLKITYSGHKIASIPANEIKQNLIVQLIRGETYHQYFTNQRIKIVSGNKLKMLTDQENKVFKKIVN